VIIIKSKILVVYYSRTGTTKKVAEELSKKLKADSKELIDLKNRKGAVGYILAGSDATLKKKTKLKKTRKDPGKYECIIIGTPVWAWSMTPAVRTYILKNKKKLKASKVAFFCTMSGMAGKTLKEMEAVSGTQAFATTEIATREVLNKKYSKKLNAFAALIKKH